MILAILFMLVPVIVVSWLVVTLTEIRRNTARTAELLAKSLDERDRAR